MNTEKMKEHFKKHKWKYVLGGAIVLAGVTTLILRSNARMPYLIVGADCPAKESMERISLFNSASIGDNATITTNVYNQVKGHPGFITRCVTTGELFETQGAAARAFGIDERIMSNHLNYGRELQEGLHFERVGVLS